MAQFVAIVIPDPWQDGWLVCRRSEHTMTTAVSSHLLESSAERERKALQAKYDFDAAKPPVDPNAPRQLVLGFYGPEQGD